MLKIGITGGIGSGKTTVCRIFESMGIPVFYADKVAKEIMVMDDLLIEGVKDTFGNLSYHNDGTLNNKHIADLVFNDATQLEKLNALVHPAVFRAFDNWLSNLPLTAPYVLKEAALLFESGSYTLCDKNVLVIAPTQLKLSRVITRDNTSKEQVLARMDKQFSDEKKLKMTDYIIHNNESQSLIIQAIELHHQFLQLTS